MLHIICALKPEARPFLDHFNLRPQTAAGSVQIYQNPRAGITLTISGIGKSAAGSAANFTRDYFKADKTHAWLNTGIAGHASLPVGQAVIIKKITAADTRQTWFPSRVFTTTLPACDLITLDKPDREYRTELFDMECAGFFQTVTGFSTLELVQAVKIISDNAAQPLDGVNPALISRLMTQNLPVIEEVIQQLLALSNQQQRINHTGEDFNEIIKRRHFTVSQQHQLQALLRKWRVLYPRETGLANRLIGQNSAKRILEFLQDELDRAPIKFSF